MDKPQPTKRPLVRACFFVLAEEAYAWIAWDLQLNDWECVPVASTAPRGTTEWAEDAFAACLKAYRTLQARHSDKDVVVSLELPPGIPSDIVLHGAGWSSH